jgi:hypothetical protein
MRQPWKRADERYGILRREFTANDEKLRLTTMAAAAFSSCVVVMAKRLD